MAEVHIAPAAGKIEQSDNHTELHRSAGRQKHTEQTRRRLSPPQTREHRAYRETTEKIDQVTEELGNFGHSQEKPNFTFGNNGNAHAEQRAHASDKPKPEGLGEYIRSWKNPDFAERERMHRMADLREFAELPFLEQLRLFPALAKNWGGGHAISTGENDKPSFLEFIVEVFAAIFSRDKKK
jgi:hypothetical protein